MDSQTPIFESFYRARARLQPSQWLASRGGAGVFSLVRPIGTPLDIDNIYKDVEMPANTEEVPSLPAD